MGKFVREISEKFSSATSVRQFLSLFVFLTVCLLMTVFSYEFFRHTEADRTLIAVEMMQGGDFLYPHLVGSKILTKPPLYYWFLAAIIKLFNSFDEWVVRLSSVISALFLFTVISFTTSKIKNSFSYGLILSIFSLISFGSLQKGSVAEIDMFFVSLFTSGVLFCALGTTKKEFLYIIIGYLLGGLSVLAKGIPGMVFSLSINFVSLIITIAFSYFEKCSLKLDTNTNLIKDILFNNKKLIVWHLVSLVLFFLVVLCWPFLLYLREGSGIIDEFLFQLKIEVLDRAIGDARIKRGTLFYIKDQFFVLMPWSIPLIYALILYVKKIKISNFFKVKKIDSRFISQLFREDNFISIFSTISFFIILIPLSVSSGKASRYGYPLVVFSSMMLLEFYLYFAGKSSKFSKIINPSSLFYGLVLVFFLRVVEGSFFATYRNESKSVQPMVKQLSTMLPENKLYTIEFFERWVSYYLLKDYGIKTERITDQLISELARKPRKIRVLISEKEESWRIDQLSKESCDVKVINRFNNLPNPAILVEVSSDKLEAIRPHPFFPTRPSLPYYWNSY